MDERPDSKTTASLNPRQDEPLPAQDQAPGTAWGSKWSWKHYTLWGAVVLVGGAIIALIVLCVKGKNDDGNRAHPAKDLQITALLKRPQSIFRRYQHTVFPNGMQVVNVEDGSSLTSAYGMAVRTGSFDDPKEVPGLAHLCEHMLFLGTKKYPEATGYDEFVGANGGFMNAYTAEETTVYFTELASSAFGEGLRRFADFFRAPLFSRQYAEREVHAIDSEHGKNVQDPAWRVNDLMLSLAERESPVGKFHTGNLDTLWEVPRKQGIDLVDTLRKWFQAHYCPSRYQLVTFGPESLESQLRRAYEEFGSLSGGAHQCQGERHSHRKPLAWSENTTGLWTSIQGTQPLSELVVFFPLPDLRQEYSSQPLQYINYVLTYGGEDSFVKVIRDTLGLVSSVSLSSDTTSAGTSLWLSCRLAPAGRDHPDLILDLLFQYLHLLQRKGMDMDLYQSLANVSKISWDWTQARPPAEAVADLAERMTRLPPEKLLSGDELIEDLDVDLMARLFQKLTPRNMNVAVIDPDARKTLFPGKVVLNSTYYGTEYTVTKIEQQLPSAVLRWRAWQEMTEEEVATEVSDRLLTLNISYASSPVPRVPSGISGIMADFNLDHMQAEEVAGGWSAKLFGKFPTLLEDVEEELESPHSKMRNQPKVLGKMTISARGGTSTRDVWYRQGWMTPSPKVQMQFLFRPRADEDSPVEMDALSALRLGFFTTLLTENMAPKVYDLTAAGSSFDFALKAVGGQGGMLMTFEGFPPLLPLIIKKVVTEIDSGLDLSDTARFERLRAEFNESFRDYSGMPLDYAIVDRNVLLTTNTHSPAESLAALANITTTSVQNAPDELVNCRPLDLTALIMGNIANSDAEDLVDVVMEGISSVQSISGTLSGTVQRLAPVVKPAKPIELRKRNPREGDTNDAVVVTLLAGVATVENRVIFGLLGQILSTLAYNHLRTERQLGYVVSAGVALVSNVQYVSAVLQGDVATADEMEAAVEHVYADLMPERLRNLTQSEFDTLKEAFRKQLLQPPVSITEEFGHFWSPISNEGQCFYLLNEMLDFMDTRLEDKRALLEAWEKLAIPSPPLPRKKVVVKYFAERVAPRMSARDALQLWSDQGLHLRTRELLSVEYKETAVLDRADSLVRQQLAEEGSYYPTTLICAQSDDPPTTRDDDRPDEEPEVREPKVRYSTVHVHT